MCIWMGGYRQMDECGEMAGWRDGWMTVIAPDDEKSADNLIEIPV